MTKSNISDLTSKHFHSFKNYRRYIHANPEMANNEVNTSNFVKEILETLKIEYQDNIGGYGVVGLIKGAFDGPTIMIRADMDALPINEETELSFSSNNENIMHACGHDIHTANLIGVATVLNSFKDQMHGNVKLCFQPAEEGAGGAIRMVDEGVLENPKVDYVIGMHVDPSIEVGSAAIEVGAVTAYPEFFKITLTGSGGHGSVPYKSIDPILPGIRIYDSLNLITKEICPLNPNVLQICAFNSGSAPAAIPDVCEIKGTVRTHFIEDKRKIRDRLFEFTESIAKLYNVNCEIDYWGEDKPVFNDEVLTQRAKVILDDVFDKGLVSSVNFKLAGEDFSTYSNLVPSTLFVVGCSNNDPKTQFALHNCRFNPDEDVLKYGVEALSTIALDYLNVK